MGDALIIRDLRKSTGSCNEISAEVDGDRVFFQTPLQYALSGRGEPFLGIALLEAMIRNVDIKVEDSIPISEMLCKKLPEIQAVYACWNPDLNRIKVHATTDRVQDAYPRVASFFSAGVDASHTLLRNMSEITHLIMLSRFEAGRDSNTPESWQQGLDKQIGFAQTIGKDLIPVDTNAKQWVNKRKIAWGFAQGLILSSMGPLLSAKRIYIASSHTYNQLFPWGSHPLTDPMWSTESTEVIHDGAGFRRGDKMRDLCKNQTILDNLKVCWRSNHYNCGDCEKCVRTMTALYLLGASSKGMPRLESLKKLKTLRASDESGFTFLEDAILLAENAKNRKVQRILRRYYAKYKMREALAILDRYMIGGIFHRLYQILGNPGHTNLRVTLRGLQHQDN